MPQTSISILTDKRIVLAVTGSIAAYKTIDLASKLTQAGALVEVILTAATQRFVTPLTFQAVTGRAVYTSMWEQGVGAGLPTHIAHVGLGESADLLVIAPATANSLAKLARGEADDLLTVTTLAARCPILVAPAMDGGMYEHPATQSNLEILRSREATIIEPDEGRFASGLVGKGRLPDTQTLIGHIRRVLGREGSLQGQCVLVTAGGTREALDPVRFVTNHSSGKQGYALAQAALDAGADVTLISAARDLRMPVGAQLIVVDSAREMRDNVVREVKQADILLMAAAISDYRPATTAAQKIKKSADPNLGLTLDLTRNPDILLDVKQWREKGDRRLKLVVGFAAESQDVLDNAQSKLERKGLDLIIANDISATDAGFRADMNRVIMLDHDGGQTVIDLTSKARIAELIVERVSKLLQMQ